MDLSRLEVTTNGVIRREPTPEEIEAAHQLLIETVAHQMGKNQQQADDNQTDEEE